MEFNSRGNFINGEWIRSNGEEFKSFSPSGINL